MLPDDGLLGICAALSQDRVHAFEESTVGENRVGDSAIAPATMTCVGTGIGTAVFAARNEPVWIAVGVAIGAALGWRKPKNKD